MSEFATVAGALDEARHRLRAAGIEDANHEARLLLGHAADLDATAIISHPERHLSPKVMRTMADVVSDRARRRSIAQVTGTREFWSLPFRVTPMPLDPRPDSEAIIRAALNHVGDRSAPCKVLDLGTGSGCLLLALLSELPNALGLGTDICAKAITVAASNAATLGHEERAWFAVANWDRGLTGQFDVIACNPPYIPSDEIDLLPPEISRYEPRRALDGGRDGFDAYRTLAPSLARLLTCHGFAAVEIGAGQRSVVESIFADARLEIAASVADLSGIPRCLVVRIKTELTQWTYK